jgi:hypothetical protein
VRAVSTSKSKVSLIHLSRWRVFPESPRCRTASQRNKQSRCIANKLIRCDRSDPCENCVRSKVQCKYADDPRTAHILHPTNRSRERNPLGSSASLQQQQHGRTFSTSSVQQLQFQMFQQQQSAAAAVDAPEIIQSLTERIRRMEQELAEATLSDPSRKNSAVSSTGSAISAGFPVARPINGMFSEKQYFGQSHWMNCVKQVRVLFFTPMLT